MSQGVAAGFTPGWSAGSLASVGFDSAQLYSLIGGPDYLRFLVPFRVLPFGYVGEDSSLWRMRQELSFAFAGMGLTDGEGVPCASLASVVAPVRDCAFAVADGVMPSASGGDDSRSYAMYFGAGGATFCRFAQGQESREVFNLVGAGPSSGWEGAFASCSGLAGVFRLAGRGLYVRCADESQEGMLAGVGSGNVDAARALAAAGGVDPAPLVDLARGIDEERYHMLAVQGVDYRRTRLATISQARDVRVGPQPWVFSFLVPEVGVVMRSVYEANPDPDLSVWDERRTVSSYMDIEFVAGGSLLERLTGVSRDQWGACMQTRTISKE
ncbi:hypothetical protein [Bifidobacterium bombi]|uniref:Uncharacterized protein n=1 Tax=Bifidobacterium bombi DSM 19703 TaxID=1341695 RepID=A0A080N3S3_9BIFI|nr:hypothetical protein [Bifidobacterium bombi]KFF31696.1 hypothetical protein BBOMB_1083 [Bifidobacterium bombi DSM 19703]